MKKRKKKTFKFKVMTQRKRKKSTVFFKRNKHTF